MAIERFDKQPFEEFPIEGDFSGNMAAGETISNLVVVATDKNGADVTTAVTDNPQTLGGGAVSVLVKAGTVALSPYKVSFRITTSIANKWELDIGMRIKEL